MNPLGAPKAIFPGKALNEVDGTLRNSWSTASLGGGGKLREESKALSVPPDDGVRLPEQESVSPMGKGAGEQNDEGSFVSMGLWLLDAPC